MPYSDPQARKLYFQNYRERNRNTLAKKKQDYHKKTYIKKGRRTTTLEHKKRKKAECDKRYREKHKEKIRREKQCYLQANQSNVYKKAYQRAKTLTGRIRCNYLLKISQVIRNKLKKSAKLERAIGCSLNAFKAFIESKFQPGMTWGNYGRGYLTGLDRKRICNIYGDTIFLKQWQIDHIIPLSKFNLEDPDQFLRAFHYTNCQPLWSTANLKKAYL